jgi:(S)-sulfolactate dehydrogenase
VTDIVISEFMDPEPLERLRAAYAVHLDEDLWNKRGELEERIAGASALIVRNRTQVDAALIANATKLRVIGRLGVGLDNIDLNACKTRGIAVCPAVGANANAVAEFIVGAAIMLLRWAAFSGSARVMQGEWPRQAMGEGREAAGKTLGIIGYGSIGRITADKAKALSFEVMAFDPFVEATSSLWHDMQRVDLPTLLAEADVITLHCPLTPETRGLIGAAEIAAVKPGAVVINTARGGIVSEAALAAALRSGHLGGAALDVFEAEPIDRPTAALFAGLPNVLLTPHIAGITAESNRRISTLTVDNVLRVLAQDQP